MKRPLKTTLLFIGLTVLIGMLVFWYQADDDDYFKSNYKYGTDQDDFLPSLGVIFSGKADSIPIRFYYEQGISDTSFNFPRQPVKKIKLFRNIPMVGVFTAKTLCKENNKTFLNFCNDTANFDWGENTLSLLSEAEYYARLYDINNQVVGKIFFCINNCNGMTYSLPMCPRMKFGKLSENGLRVITNIINDKTLWE